MAMTSSAGLRKALLTLVLVAPLYATDVIAQCQPRSNLTWSHPPTIASGVSARVIYNGLNEPRGIKVDSESNLLVIERDVGVIALTFREAGEGACAEGEEGWERKVVVPLGELNHGIDFGEGGKMLYVSTHDVVLEFAYDAKALNATGTTDNGRPRTIVQGMGSAGDHGTRTLTYQPANNSNPAYIIVSRGSDSNIELEAANIETGTAQIRRFALNDSIPDEGHDWLGGELVGYGLRNSVGMTLGEGNKLWTVENSADEMTWNGQDVHKDNPAEEMNVIDLNNVTGAYYGYPHCFTSWDMNAFSGPETGAQFTPQNATFTINNNVTDITDEWCNDEGNVVRPSLSFQGHVAPLDVKFYHGATVDDRSYSLSEDWEGQAFVSFHGSWNRQPPTGYGVVRVPWDSGVSSPEAAVNDKKGYEFVVQAPDLNSCPSACIRPVGLDFDSFGRLFVSSDATGEIFILENSTSPDAELSDVKSTSAENRKSQSFACLAVVIATVLVFAAVL